MQKEFQQFGDISNGDPGVCVCVFGVFLGQHSAQQAHSAFSVIRTENSYPQYDKVQCVITPLCLSSVFKSIQNLLQHFYKESMFSFFLSFSLWCLLQ